MGLALASVVTAQSLLNVESWIDRHSMRINTSFILRSKNLYANYIFLIYFAKKYWNWVFFFDGYTFGSNN